MVSREISTPIPSAPGFSRVAKTLGPSEVGRPPALIGRKQLAAVCRIKACGVCVVARCLFADSGRGDHGTWSASQKRIGGNGLERSRQLGAKSATVRSSTIMALAVCSAAG
jgi:hypothetical protein